MARWRPCARGASTAPALGSRASREEGGPGFGPHRAGAFLGIGEDPPGSNCNAITRWYGQGCIPWAAAAVGKACFDAGFNDGAGHRAMPGIPARTEHGFAWVGDLRRAFEAAGRSDGSPRRGDIAIVGGDRHACLVEAVRVDGIVRTIEGDYHDDVRALQSRLAERGWRIPVDGVSGPPDPAGRRRVPAPEASRERWDRRAQNVGGGVAGSRDLNRALKQKAA